MDVGLALKRTSKGQLKYDRFWSQEGRTKEVFDEISKYSSHVSLKIDPKILSLLSIEDKDDFSLEKDKKKEDPPDQSFTKNLVCGKKFANDTYFYKSLFETELPIMEYEEDRLKYVQDAFDCKKSQFDNFSAGLTQQQNQEYLWLQRKKRLDEKRRKRELQKLEDSILEEAKNKELQLREQYVKKLSAKIQEAELKQKRAEEELRKRENEQMELKLQMTHCLQEATNFFHEVEEKLKICEHQDLLRMPIENRMHYFASLLEPIAGYVKKDFLSIDDLEDANHRVKDVYNASQDVLNDIESAKSKAASVEQRKISVSSSSSFEKISGSVGIAYEVKSKDCPIDTIDCKGKGDQKALSYFIAPDAIEEYHKIMENLKRVEDRLLPLKSDPKNKKYRFELQKSVNVPINSLSSNSGSQIKSKVSRLLSLLGGQVPALNGRDMSSDEVVYSFCSYLIAKQFVEQGDSQISAQPATAFPCALAVVGVWSKKPDLGPLILAHFYVRCPYLVPYYPPREQGKSDKEYYEALGYRFDDQGNLEEEYKFLNRMSGYMRLYAAILVSPLPPNAQTNHPYGVAHGWRWLTRTLNLQPRPGITATLIYAMLQVTGNKMYSTYGKQFKKLLHILCKEYFQKIKLVTPGGTGGPIERLESFLQQTVTRGRIPTPEGFLDQNFWNR